MKADNKQRERARNFILKFKEPLSSKLLSDLSEERRFYTKYRRLFKSIKIGDEVIGLIVEDSFDIIYSIDQAGITARSFVKSEDNVIKKLKLMGDRIIELFDLEKSSYKIIEGADFRYLENSLLENWFKNVDIIKKIKREFEGEEEPQLIQIKFVIKNADGNKLINLVHENVEKLDEKRLLIEANKEYLLTDLHTVPFSLFT